MSIAGCKMRLICLAALFLFCYSSVALGVRIGRNGDISLFALSVVLLCGGLLGACIWSAMGKKDDEQSESGGDAAAFDIVEV